MGKYHEAVAKGGDNWWIYLDEPARTAHARSLVYADTHRADDCRMYMAEKYPATRRSFQTYTPGV
jgi:hypothetical protein